MMSYIEIKNINGRKYKYLRTSHRAGNRVTHTSKYLCPVEPKNKTKKVGEKYGIQKKK